MELYYIHTVETEAQRGGQWPKIRLFISRNPALSYVKFCSVNSSKMNKGVKWPVSNKNLQ